MSALALTLVCGAHEAYLIDWARRAAAFGVGSDDRVVECAADGCYAAAAMERQARDAAFVDAIEALIRWVQS